jgi:uncharacterized protein (TIRG00374 family)
MAIGEWLKMNTKMHPRKGNVGAIKTRIKSIFFILVGIAILSAMVLKIGAANIYQEFSKANPYLLAGAFFLTLLGFVIKIFRWGKLYPIAGQMDAWRIYLIGMAVNQTMPAGSGELTRAYIARSRLNVPVGETLAPVMIERLADTTFMLALSVGYLAFITVGNGYLLQLVMPSSILFAGYYLLLKPDYI